MYHFITPILIAIILPLVFSFFFRAKSKEEKKIENQDTIRTKPPKALSIFFLVFAVIFFALAIIGSISSLENITSLILCATIFSAFSLLSIFGFLWVRFNYVILDSDGVHVFHLFKKNSFYRYNEIGYFLDTSHLGMAGEIIGYDKNKKKIFAIEAVHVGANFVVQRLIDRGIERTYQKLKKTK